MNWAVKSSLSDAELVNLHKSGDDEAFEILALRVPYWKSASIRLRRRQERQEFLLLFFQFFLNRQDRQEKTGTKTTKIAITL